MAVAILRFDRALGTLIDEMGFQASMFESFLAADGRPRGAAKPTDSWTILFGSLKRLICFGVSTGAD